MFRKVNFILPQEVKKTVTKRIIDKFYFLHSDPVKEYLDVVGKYNEENKQRFLKQLNKGKLKD